MPDIVYALRHEPHVRDEFGFGPVQCYPDTARPGELALLAAEVERLEGRASRGWFETWAQRPSSELLLLRDAAQQPAAFALYLRLDAKTMAAARDDPGMHALSTHLCKHAPLRGAEQVLLARFRMAYASHQAPTPAWAQLRSHLNARMFTPGISILAAVADLAYPWIGMEENGEYLLLADSDYRIGGHAYKISAHDLRREPALEWARNSVERVLRDAQQRLIESLWRLDTNP